VLNAHSDEGQNPLAQGVCRMYGHDLSPREARTSEADAAVRDLAMCDRCGAVREILQDATEVWNYEAAGYLLPPLRDR
jgi:hypothetical protein